MRNDPGNEDPLGAHPRPVSCADDHRSVDVQRTVAQTRHVLETIAGYLHEQGLISKRLNLETAFASNTLNL